MVLLTRRLCTIDGCPKHHVANGYCDMHYRRIRRHGSPQSRGAAERFWERVDKSGEHWLWTASCDEDGYGIISVRGKSERAHRFSYELAYGEIPPGLWVLHRCAIRPCVHPDHLYAGTATDNNRDTIRHGHHVDHDRHPKGSALGAAARLNEAQVLEIRARRASGEPIRELVSAFGVSKQTISAVTTRVSWRHV